MNRKWKLLVVLAGSVILMAATVHNGRGVSASDRKVSGRNAQTARARAENDHPDWDIVDEALEDSGQDWDIVVFDDEEYRQSQQNAAEEVQDDAPAFSDGEEVFDEAAMEDARFGETIDYDDEEWFRKVPTVTPLPKNSYVTEIVMEHYLDIMSMLDNLPVRACLDAEELLQRPELPTGCESVALTIALNTLGFDLDKTEIAENYLIYSQGNFVIGYVGNPYTDDGAGIYPPGIVRTADLFLSSMNSVYTGHDLTGCEVEDLFACIAAGYPVLVWWTVDYKEPRMSTDFVEYGDETFWWYRNEHCVMLQGYDLDTDEVILQDPEKGQVRLDIDRFKEIYEAVGRFAVGIY
ncbi:MAG: C39 family peptidase [Blautia sp.]|nr:C39 family peptidase [Blautia sp.]